MHEFAIFDFDGTLTDLNVDWVSLKKEISVTRISDLWDFGLAEKQNALSIISDIELKGTKSKLNFDRRKFERFSKFAILTNNSEKTVEYFFELLNLSHKWPRLDPALVVGRETLQGSKEVQEVFQSGIRLIFETLHIKNASDCCYIGDQNYELSYAAKFGLRAIDILNF
jgi:phosphoglycolate phosphatase-like HAD superfamily hydrolase